MQIQSILNVPASRALAIMHSGKDFLKAIPKIYWVAAVGISLLAGVFYRFASAKKASLPMIATESNPTKVKTFEDSLLRYQQLNALLVIIEDLRILIENGDNKETNQSEQLKKVEMLYVNNKLFQALLLQCKKDKDIFIGTPSKNQSEMCDAFVTFPIAKTKFYILNCVETSIVNEKEELKKFLDENIPQELQGVEFLNGDMYSGICYCESLIKKLGKTVKERHFYPRFFFDKCREYSKSSAPSADFMKYNWQEIVLVQDPIQHDLKEAFILRVELPLCKDIENYKKLPGDTFIDRFTADQKTMDAFVYSKV